MKDDITIVCDLLLNEYGSARPASLIAKDLSKRGYSIKIVSNIINEEINKNFQSHGISTFSLNRKPCPKDESIIWFRLWFEEAFLHRNSLETSKFNSVILNFSNTIAMPSHIWYVQGLPTVTLRNMKPHLPLRYKLPYMLMAKILNYGEKKINRKFASLSKKIIANSRYSASQYENLGINVDSIIYPPLDCKSFKPVTSRPSGDYFLTYFGKETQFRLVKRLLDEGIKIKSFGSKLSIIPKAVREHPNLESFGYVTKNQLIDLYSNALATLFPFSDEPFGYIPVESMACGTPVLTYNKHGPKESIIHESTGWLVKDDRELLEKAVEIWKKGYDSHMRSKCRKRSLNFDIERIAPKWIKIIDSIESDTA